MFINVSDLLTTHITGTNLKTKLLACIVHGGIKRIIKAIRTRNIYDQMLC